MAIFIKTLLAVMAAYIGTIWPGAWTSLLITIALTAFFIGMAAETYEANRNGVKRASPSVE